MPARKDPLAFFGGAIVGGVVLTGLGLVGGLGWMLAALVPVMLLGADRAEREGGRVRAGVEGVVAVVIVGFGARLVHTAWAGIAAPPEWDFQAFRLFGEMAARHLDFYRPEHAWAIAGSVEHSEDFKRAILDVGFWYPPPTMLLFWPLGWFGLHTAAALWYAALVLQMVAAALLLRALFLPDGREFGLAIVVALMLLLRATHATVLAAQTNFLVLLLVLLFWRDRELGRGGIWLALGALVKPFVAVLLLEPFLRGRWRTLVAAAATAAAEGAIAVLAFGVGPMSTYLHGDVAARMPDFVFTEVENQSLLATLLRWTHAAPPGPGVPLPRSYLALVAVSLLLTVVVVYRLRGPLEELGIGLVLSWTLVIYPATLHHYAVLSLAPLLWIWRRRAELPGRTPAVVALITAEYVMIGAAHATYVFAAYALCFVTLLALGAWTERAHAIALRGL